ncbi:hypothetical protein E9993_17370 [Labilibacter sediminis]|nr:hypothetical protein E9993_17370 [Labilibacter sediminis]
MSFQDNGCCVIVLKGRLNKAAELNELVHKNLTFCINPKYSLENLLHIEITSKQDTLLLHCHSPERCYASFQ